MTGRWILPGCDCWMWSDVTWVLWILHGCDSGCDFLICMARERAARAENFGRNFTYSTRFLTNVTGGLEVRHFWLDVTLDVTLEGWRWPIFGWMWPSHPSHPSHPDSGRMWLWMGHFQGNTLGERVSSGILQDWGPNDYYRSEWRLLVRMTTYF